MQKRIVTGLLALTTLCTPLCGQRSFTPKTCYNFGNFEAEGELLYLQPSYCDLQYCIVDERKYVAPTGHPLANTEQAGPMGDSRSVKPRYDFGFRLAPTYVFPGGCFDIKVQYTYLHAHEVSRQYGEIQKFGTVKEEVNGKEVEVEKFYPQKVGVWASRVDLVNVNIPAGTPPFQNIVLYDAAGSQPKALNVDVRAMARFDYDSGELQFGARNRCFYKLWMRTFAAVHAAYVYHQFRVDYNGTLHPVNMTAPFEAQAFTGLFDRRIQGWAVGPKLGFEATYDLPCNFGLGLRLGFGVLAGKTHYDHQQRVITQEAANPGAVTADRIMDVHGRSQTIAVPTFNVRGGFNYTWCCANEFCVMAELGYEIISYSKFLATTPKFRLDSGVSAVNCADFGLDGFYLSFLVLF